MVNTRLPLFCYFSLSDILTPRSDCVDGDIRLMDGTNITEGRVEVCINNAWGTICDDAFSAEDAEVICYQLQFDRRGKYSVLYIAAAKSLYVQ